MSQRARRAQAHRAQRRGQVRVLGAVGLGIAVAALAVGIAGWAGSRGDSTDSPPDGKTLRVSMTEFAFDPDPIVSEHGAEARFEVVNDGAVPHNLLISALGKGTPDLPPGQSMVLDLSNQPAGTYRVVCDLPGHTAAGMVTELILR